MACLQIYRELLPFVTFLRIPRTQKSYPTSINKICILTLKKLAISS